MQPSALSFAHRANRDGTVNSICRECRATVATSMWEADLDGAEKLHRCDPSWTDYVLGEYLPGGYVAKRMDRAPNDKDPRTPRSA